MAKMKLIGLSMEMFSEMENRITYEVCEYNKASRSNLMDKVVREKGGYYICLSYDGNQIDDKATLWNSSDALYECIDRSAIKEGIDLFETEYGFKMVAYYGNWRNGYHLIHCTDQVAKAIDDSDFDETIVLNAMASQYAYNRNTLDAFISLAKEVR